MNSGLVSSRYAKALYDFSKLKGKPERVYQDVLLLSESLDNVGQIGECIPRLCDETQTFLQLVIRNKRVGYLKFICICFISLYRKENGITSARLVSASESRELEAKVTELLKAEGYTKIEFDSEVNPDLLGGFVLTVDDKRLDASLSTQLKTIAKEFEEKNKRII
jgi:F0F1-type ATP synthase, delta subunit (mitochondrial oligomycin sensitivity protein)